MNRARANDNTLAIISEIGLGISQHRGQIITNFVRQLVMRGSSRFKLLEIIGSKKSFDLFSLSNLTWLMELDLLPLFEQPPQCGMGDNNFVIRAYYSIQ